MNESATVMNGMLRRATSTHRLDTAVQPTHIEMPYERYGRKAAEPPITTPA